MPLLIEYFKSRAKEERLAYRLGFDAFKEASNVPHNDYVFDLEPLLYHEFIAYLEEKSANK